MRVIELYQEPKGSTFTHDGKIYDLNALLRLTEMLDIEEIPLDQLEWVFDFDTPDGDQSRIEDSDLSAPILVTWWWNEEGHSQLVVIDGLHRVAKGLEDGLKTLPGRYVDASILEIVEL